ncbi:MAG: squalene--hopene cyclase, partial [Planctomycetes bacterium]|nr:squalene--hopene cyclase [Planctomycetota bacterium]
MSSGRRDSGRLRFELLGSVASNDPKFVSTTQSSPTQSTRDERLDAAIAQTRDYLLARQNEEGYWVGELEGDTILESEYILLLAFLGREKSEIALQAANYILEKQLPEGGWASYPGGPLEISVSVKAYFALKLTGRSADAEFMQRARSAILEAGGAEKINSFSRYYLALLGVISYEQCPAVPPELILIPNWMPLNIYEMSAWSRTIVVPLSLLWAFRPDRAIPEEQSIRELFVDEPEKLPMCMGPSGALDETSRKTWIDWNRFFNRLDRFLKFLERCRLRPFRKLAVRRATDWILQRFENSDGLGAIFPPIVWSVIALKCLGYDDDSPEVQSALGELEKLTIREGDTARLEPCKSPVWDTALTTLALRDAEVPADHPAIRRAVDWLLSKEVRSKGDWSQLKNDTDVGGWYFEFNNECYPDLDDTSMVVMALCRTLPAAGQTGWSAEFLLDDWSPHEADKDAAAILSTQDATAHSAFRDVEMLTPQLTAIRRGVRWILAMQSSDGGWGAFDADNNRELFTQVPFADHNAMIDPSTADFTARILEMFSYLNVPGNHP